MKRQASAELNSLNVCYQKINLPRHSHTADVHSLVSTGNIHDIIYSRLVSLALSLLTVVPRAIIINAFLYIGVIASLALQNMSLSVP